jgi:hypothetical protein
VKRTIFLTAFVSLLGMICLGCGSTTLKTIELTAPTTTLYGIGGTLQLQATGFYSYGPARDLTDKVTYTIVIAPAPYDVDVNGNPLPTPPLGVKIDTFGFVTAVEPGVCTYEDVGTTTTAVWALTGTYQITASYGGVTSQPFYLAMASATGSPNPPASGLCGPTPNQ